MLYQKYLNYLNGRKILILGENGFLASRFKQWSEARQNPFDFFSLRNAIGKILNGGDENPITDKIAQYDVVINTVANTNTHATDGATILEQIALNYAFAGTLADFCKKAKIDLCHISSACLYRSGDNLREDAPICADSPYYCSKYLGDCLVAESNPDAIVLRPRLFFDERKNPKNLLDKLTRYDILYYGLQSVTSTDGLIAAALHLLSQKERGIFNVAEPDYLAFVNYFEGKTYAVAGPNVKFIELNLQKLKDTGFEFEEDVFSKMLKNYGGN